MISSKVLLQKMYTGHTNNRASQTQRLRC